MDGGSADGMVRPLAALATRMTCCAIGERQYHPHVYLSTLRCTATTGQRDSEFWSCFATLLRNPVINGWSCGVGARGVERGARW